MNEILNLGVLKFQNCEEVEEIIFKKKNTRAMHLFLHTLLFHKVLSHIYTLLSYKCKLYKFCAPTVLTDKHERWTLIWSDILFTATCQVHHWISFSSSCYGHEVQDQGHHNTM